jgi:hypothetical protein
MSDQFNQLAKELNNISFEETSFIKKLDKCYLQAHQCTDQFYQRKRKQFEIFLQEEKEK